MQTPGTGREPRTRAATVVHHCPSHTPVRSSAPPRDSHSSYSSTSPPSVHVPCPRKSPAASRPSACHRTECQTDHRTRFERSKGTVASSGARTQSIPRSNRSPIHSIPSVDWSGIPSLVDGLPRRYSDWELLSSYCCCH